jgi:hypothetical protein
MSNETIDLERERDRSPAAVQADNLIRRRLRVGNPSDPVEIAGGLRRVFRAEGQALDRETSGLPITRVATPGPAGGPVEGPSAAEMDQARHDIEEDLKSLVSDGGLKDVRPELEGWSRAIRGIVAEGSQAARLSLDPRQRDRAFAARAQLADYSRIARLVGVMSPGANGAFRQLATSLDQAAALVLVQAGEALAHSGHGAGRFLLQAPASELQARRDAVLIALRSLSASTDDAYAANQWPRGLQALQLLREWLDQSGMSDLRALLDENGMGRVLDELIDQASGMNGRSLRALGAVAPVTLHQLQQLLLVSQRRVDPESPTLATFRFALRHFLDAFVPTNPQRMVTLARPAIVFHGLYGLGAFDAGTARLQALLAVRGRLAHEADCVLRCECHDDLILVAILIDKLVRDLDRAVDLYAQGRDAAGDGEPEQRAAAYGAIADLVVALALPGGLPATFTVYGTSAIANLLAELNRIRNQLATRAAWGTAADPLWQVLFDLQNTLLQVTPAARPIWDLAVLPGNATQRALADRASRMQATLCAQRAAEWRWFDLSRSLTAGCLDIEAAHRAIDAFLAATLFRITNADACPPWRETLPPDVATSQAGWVYGRPSDGGP